MNEFKDAKNEYENTPIPEELNDRVQAGIRQGKAARARRKWRQGLTAAAACFAVAVGALNLSPTVAAAAADVPVLGGLFQVLTVRSYDTEKDQIHYQVEVPEVEADSGSTRRSSSMWTPTSQRWRPCGRSTTRPSSPPAAPRRSGRSGHWT